MHVTQIELANFTQEHLDGALRLSRQAGWPYRREDLAMMLALSTGAVALEGGHVVGTALATRYGTGAATISMVIVDDRMRGCGIGRKLMASALEEAEGRECRLVATQEGLPLYEKLGFRMSGEIAQHQGTLTKAPAEDVDPGIDWAGSHDIDAIAELDRAACGMDRRNLITFLAEHGRIAVLRNGGRPSGFAALRAFGRGEVAGPVVAATVKDARKLLSFLFATRSGAFLRVDTPATSGLSQWLSALGLARVGGGITMRRGGTGSIGTKSVHTFGLASQALG